MSKLQASAVSGWSWSLLDAENVLWRADALRIRVMDLKQERVGEELQRMMRSTLWPITEMRVCMQYTFSNSDINLKVH